MSRKACLLGATGLIGGELLNQLLKDPYYQEVHILVRRPFTLSSETGPEGDSSGSQHAASTGNDRSPEATQKWSDESPQNNAKLRVRVIDFSNAEEYRTAIRGCETVFCAVGTTLKKVNGNREAYRKVDYDIAVTAATEAAAAGVFGFCLVSSVGADANNGHNFYLKLKGVVEEAVSKLKIPQVHIFRPSLLLGRRNEKRFGEGLARFFAPLYSVFMFGRNRKYKPIQAEQVAQAMLKAAKSTGKGIFVHHYDEIQNLVRNA